MLSGLSDKSTLITSISLALESKPELSVTNVSTSRMKSNIMAPVTVDQPASTFSMLTRTVVWIDAVAVLDGTVPTWMKSVATRQNGHSWVMSLGSQSLPGRQLLEQSGWPSDSPMTKIW